MDGFVGRRGLLPEETLRELTRRSDLRGAVQTVSHFGAIVLTGFVLHHTWGTWLAVPVFVLHGMLLNYLFAAQHEFNHYTAFRTRWVNDVCNRITGFLVLYPRDYERWFHFQHHRHTQDWSRDPELKGREPYTLTSYLLYLSGVSYWVARIRKLLVQARGGVSDDYLTPAQVRRVVREARAHVLAYTGVALVSMAFESWFAVTYWLAPLVVTKVLHQVQNITEHTGLTHAPDTIYNTRTIRTWAVLRWMAWNMQYHTAHHTYPAVPFHQLPALHRALCERLGHEPPTSSYLGFQARFVDALRRAPEPLEGVDEVASHSGRS